jgi:hypothetical protein
MKLWLWRRCLPPSRLLYLQVGLRGGFAGVILFIARLPIKPSIEVDLRSSCSNHAKDRLVHVRIRPMESRTVLVRVVAISKSLGKLDGDLVTFLSSLGQLARHALLQILLRRHGSEF